MDTLDAAVYQRAERLGWNHRLELVVGGKVRPHWLDRGARFWYRLDAADGHRFVLVDPAARSRQEVPAPPPHAGSDPVEVQSPDGRRAVYLRDHNLWLRDLATNEEAPLTSDGVADNAYATPPDTLSFGALMRTVGLPHLPPIVLWSPDSRRVLTHRTDQRGVATSHLVEAAPPGGGRPVLHTYRYPMPGDTAMARGELVVLDVEARTAVPAKTEPLMMPVVSPIWMQSVWWAPDGSAIYFFGGARDMRTLRLNRLDPLTGEVRTLIEESGEPRVDANPIIGPPIARVIADGREVLWYSQRDGWGHLYLYDAETGALRHQVTTGEWAVQQVLHVDENTRAVFFVAAGLIPTDPYRRQVCRVGLDDTGFTRLADDELDHLVTVPPNEAYFIDSASTTDTPPVITVRGWDGQVLVELERADISGLLAAGWTPPERFSVKAADGTTDIYGVLFRPPGFDPGERYPVVDHPYPGPHHGRVLPSFLPEFYGAMGEQVAALGFVVMAVDGRGTPGRDKAFHDYSYGRLSEAGCLQDHVAALRQLAETRPWMDLDRVGLFGISGGGFATVRGMCTFPDVYKVGVAQAGNHDQRFYNLGWGEAYDGPLDAETYTRSSNVEIADRLAGKLLLIHGEMDDNVHPHLTMRLVDRLIAANKDFDLLIVPGMEHRGIAYEHYVMRRTWDFLVRHLMGVEPPPGYRIAETVIDAETLSEVLG